MNTTWSSLAIQLHRVAQEHHRAGARYYASLQHPDCPSHKAVTERYKDSCKVYTTSLADCEDYLLSIKRAREMNEELYRIQNLIHSVRVALKYL